VPPLQSLIDAGETIALVVTQPDRAQGRGRQVLPPPVKECALAHGLPITQPERIRDQAFVDRLRGIAPEFIIVVAYGKIFPNDILAIPLRGCINIHASLLPKYRGAAPIQWAVINGERETGVATMLMDEGLDTGPVVLMKTLEIGDDDTAAVMFEKLSTLGAATLLETLRGLRQGTLAPKPQEGDPSYAPPLRKEDGRIDWRKSARALDSFVRGMIPWPSASCVFGGERIRIAKARAVEGHGEPGRIEIASGDRLLIGTGDGLLRIIELQPEGRKAMPAAAFLNGRKVREGHDHFS
jgi:methionyl-tRNA formyltransferase